MRTRGFFAGGLAAIATLAIAAAASAQVTDRDVTRPLTEGPPADQPIVPREAEPSFTVEGGVGVLGFIGGAAGLGPAWNLRLTANVSQRFALEANYTGAANEQPMTDNTLMMTALDGGVRYNILRGREAPVQPFVVAGIGYAGWAGTDGAGDPFTITVPLTAGAERLLTENIKAGVRFNAKPAFFDELGPGDSAPGGDTWSLLGHVGGGF